MHNGGATLNARTPGAANSRNAPTLTIAQARGGALTARKLRKPGTTGARSRPRVSWSSFALGVLACSPLVIVFAEAARVLGVIRG